MGVWRRTDRHNVRLLELQHLVDVAVPTPHSPLGGITGQPYIVRIDECNQFKTASGLVRSSVRADVSTTWIVVKAAPDTSASDDSSAILHGEVQLTSVVAWRGLRPTTFRSGAARVMSPARACD